MAERRGAILAWRVCVGAVLLTLWQGLVWLKVLDPFFVSRPTDIARRVRVVVGRGAFIVGTFDPHGNEDEEFLAAADMAALHGREQVTA